MKTRGPVYVGTLAASALAAAIMTASCSSVQTQTQEPLARIVHVKEGDREPASEPKVYWTHAEKQFYVGANGIHEQFTTQIQQIKEWTESIPYQDTCYRDGYTEEAGTCEGYHCSASENGKSDAWDAFFNAPKARKVSALADAIKGIGPVSAEKLVAANYFRSKPRSWQDFSDEIQRAVDNGVLGKDISYQVLVKYKAENVTNLGYDVASCTPYLYSCTVYTPGPVPYSCTKYQDQTYTRVIDSMKRNISIEVSNSVLQSFESDLATITVGRDPSDVTAEIGPYNRYNVSVGTSSDTSYVHATGIQRILVDLPRNVVRSAALRNRDGKGVFNLVVNSQYLGKGHDQLVLKYNVHTCKMNFFSICLGSYKPGDDVIVPIAQTDNAIAIPLQKKTKAKVVYTLSRKGSPWYNDNYIATFETDSVSQK